MHSNLEKALQERILLLDGAMGTMIQSFQLKEEDYRGDILKDSKNNIKGNNDILCLTQPHIIENIHRQYLSAGADIIETNTFNANSISQADYGTEKLVYEINKAAANIAKKATSDFTTDKKPRFIAGSIGPTNRSAGISPDVNNPMARNISFDKLYEAYHEQIRGLIDGGVDLLLIETVFDTINCKAAIAAAIDYFESLKKNIPIYISLTIDNSGRNLIGQTVPAFYASVIHAKPLCIGLNCSFGAEQMQPFIHELANYSHTYIGAYPNAGLPDHLGKYTQSPTDMAIVIRKLLESTRVNIIGGCCGTTPQHIYEISKLIDNISPKPKPDKANHTYLSGLEILKVEKEKNFINIGERTNVAGSKAFAKIIKEQNFEKAISIAQEQVENGAQIIDICMDDALIDGEKAMQNFLNIIVTDPSIAKVPIMIDSSRWNIIETALKCLPGKSIVNSISLKDGEAEFIRKAIYINKMGAAALVMAFDEKGQAESFERKIEICQRIYKIWTEDLQFSPENLILDPNIMAIGTGIEEHNFYAINYIKAIEWIKENLPHVKTSGGISNLSFAFRGNEQLRQAMHAVFLYHAINRGLDMGILNPSSITLYEDIEKPLLQLLEELILNGNAQVLDKILAFANNHNQHTEREIQPKWRKETVEKRLHYALLKGISEHINEDIEEISKQYKHPIEIIEGPLMTAMDEVGKLFATGKMFLPQVVKTARIMKKAVSLLMEKMPNKENTNRKTVGTIVLATVKGDVHDIGKNIASIILACNNFKVIDLGVMITAEQIVKAAIDEKADIVGLSGLITPSLEEMINVAKKMNEANLNIPLLIGGATTSKLHTAVKIAPVYKGPVIHIKDASHGASVVNALVSKNQKDDFINKIRQEYDQLKRLNESTMDAKKLISIAEARKNSYKYNNTKPIVKPKFLGTKTFSELDVKDVLPFFNWTTYYNLWDIKGTLPNITENQEYSEEIKSIQKETEEIFDLIISEKLLNINATIGFFTANKVGDDVEIYTNELKSSVISIIHFLRNQELKNKNNFNYSLADFIAEKDSKQIDYMGFFGISVNHDIDKIKKACILENDSYFSLMINNISMVLTEACAEYMQYQVQNEYWKQEKTEKKDISSNYEPNLIIRPTPGYPSCPDHSEKRQIFELLQLKSNLGMELTSTYMMIPTSSVCGYYIAHPEARYFNTGTICMDQLQDYAKRKNITIEDAKLLLKNRLHHAC